MSRDVRLRAAATAAIAASLIAAAPSFGADRLTATAVRATAPLSELAPARPLAAPGGGIIQRYRQRSGGLPVLGAGAVVAVPAGQRPILVSDTTARDLGAGDAAAAIPRSRALTAARRISGADRLRAPARAELGIDPVTGRMAWQLSLPSARPLADFLVTVDARTGKRIRSRDVLQRATGSAMIYSPTPVTEQGGYAGLRDRKDHDSDRLTSLRLPVTLERITSTKGCLVGSYVDARVGKGAKSVCAPNLDFTGLTRSNDRFEAVMAYFHIDRERAYVDSLGLTEPLRSKPQKVRADGITDDNSFYSNICLLYTSDAADEL